MLRLSLICALVALSTVQAQSGYDYNRPSKPFGQSSTLRPGSYPGGSSGQLSSGGTTPSFPSQPQNEYSSSAVTPGFPTGPNQYPGSTSQQQGQRPTQYPGTGNYPDQTGGHIGSHPEQTSGHTGNYPGQTGVPTGSYPGQAGGPTGNYPGQTGVPTGSYPGQTGGPTGSYPGQTGGPTGGYPGQTGGPTGGYPGQTGGPTGSYPGQNQQNGGTNYPEQGQNYPGQNYPGQNYPGQGGSPNFGPVGPGSGSHDTGAYEGGDYSAIPGEPDIDYPILTEIPKTAFRCEDQAYPGYYADVEARCQVFHVCANNLTYDFLCPNGTIFSQQVFVCVWWNQFDCNSAPSFYGLNANLYDYSIMGSSQQSGHDYAQGSQGLSHQGSSSNYPATGSQGPPAYPDNAGPQGPSGSYPGTTAGTQRPSGSYPGTGPQGPSSGHLDSNRPQAPSYPGNTEQRPPSGYPSPSGYPGVTGSQSPSGYPSNSQGSSGSQSPSAYPGTTGSQRPTQSSQASYPGGQGQDYHGSQPSTDGSKGYPSGRPSGPSFPSGPTGGRPTGVHNTPQSQQPNREYLPPKN